MNRRYNPDAHRRRSTRLAARDYAQAGAYLVTIVTQNRLCLFGDVVEGEMRLNAPGEMAYRVWQALAERFPTIRMDECIIMPNHLHGIIVIRQPATPDADADTRATTRVAPTLAAPTLGDVVGAYKSLTTREYGKGVRDSDWPPFDTRLWQRNYHERVIRNNQDWNPIRAYIADNPAQWDVDTENPNAVQM